MLANATGQALICGLPHAQRQYCDEKC